MDGPLCATPMPVIPHSKARRTNLSAGLPMTNTSTALPCICAENLSPPTTMLCAGCLYPDVIIIGSLNFILSCSSFDMNSSFISHSSVPLQASSFLVKNCELIDITLLFSPLSYLVYFPHDQSGS